MLVQTTSKPQNAATNRSPLVPAGMMAPFVLVTALFFLWGLPNNLNDVLIRQFMKSFQLTRFQAGLIQSAFYMGYFLLATPAALMMRRFGSSEKLTAVTATTRPPELPRRNSSRTWVVSLPPSPTR